MASSQEVTLSIPRGSLGLGIRQQDATGLCIVTSKSNSASPLHVDDVILSLNGIDLADAEGGVDAWVTLFVTFASGPRNVIVRRAAPAANSPSPLPAKSASLLNDVSTTSTKSVTPIVPASRPNVSPNVPVGAYKAGIITAITELKDRTGSSSIAIKKHMQANLPADKKWLNGMFLNALKKAVADGDLMQIKASYKLSADYKKKAAAALKPKKAAPKKKANHTIATSNQPSAHVARVSLSPRPMAAAFAQYVTTGYNTQHSPAHTNQPTVFGNAAEQNMPNFSPLPEIALRPTAKKRKIYHLRIMKAITNLKNSAGSSSYIKKDMQARMPKREKFSNGLFISTLQKMVDNGDLVQNKFTFKLVVKLGWDQPASSMAVQQAATNDGDSGGASFVLNAGNMNAATNTNSFVNAGAATVSPNGRTEQAAKVTVIVTKPSKESSLGLHIQQEDVDTVKVITMASSSLFIGTNLKAGMLLKTINGSKCTTIEETVNLLKAVEGQITIVAAVPPTAQEAVMSGVAAAAPTKGMEQRMAVARAAAGYTGPTTSNNIPPILPLPHP